MSEDKKTRKLSRREVPLRWRPERCSRTRGCGGQAPAPAARRLERPGNGGACAPRACSPRPSSSPRGDTTDGPAGEARPGLHSKTGATVNITWWLTNANFYTAADHVRRGTPPA